MDARVDPVVGVDDRLRARAVDLADGVRLGQDEVAVANQEAVAVERANGRAGHAVALGVVLAAVARAAEARRGLRRRQLDRRAAFDLHQLLLVLERQAVDLHRAAEVDAAVREDREARHAVLQAVVAHVRGAPRDLALLGVAQEGRDDEVALGIVLDRPDVDVVVTLVDERGQDREAGDREGDHPRDHAAEPERRQPEERAPAVQLGVLFRLVDRHRARRRCDCIGRRLPAGHGIAHPDEPARDHHDGADGRRRPTADHEADERDGQADREAERPEARCRPVRRSGWPLGLDH